MYIKKIDRNQRFQKSRLPTDNIQNLESSLAIFDNSNIINDIRNKIFDSNNMNTMGSEKSNQQQVQKIKMKYSPLKQKKTRFVNQSMDNKKSISIMKPTKFGLLSRFQYKENKQNEQEVKILRKQNVFLKQQIKNLQLSYNELLIKQLQRKQYELMRLNKEQIQMMKRDFRIQMQGKDLKIHELQKQIQNMREKTIKSEKYIENLQKINQNNNNEIDNNKKLVQKVSYLQKQMEQINHKNSLLQETIKQKNQQFNNTVSQLNYENYNRNPYFQQLQKTNFYLQKQNKRLTQLIMDRVRSGFR